MVSQSVLVVCILSMFIQMHSHDNLYQESAMFKRVTQDEDMKMSFKCNIVPQSVLVVCIFSTFIYIQSCVHIGR